MIANVLILEDDLSLARLYQKVLNRAGYAVTVVPTIAEARAYLYQQTYRVFLCDMRVGDGDSFEFLREHLEWLHSLGTQVAAISAHDEYEGQCSASGIHNYLAKPINNQYLVSMVDQYLGNKRDTCELRAVTLD